MKIKNIPKYLNNNPDFYIDGGIFVEANKNIIREKIDNIIFESKNMYIEFQKLDTYHFDAKLVKDGLDIGYINICDVNSYWSIDFSKISNGIILDKENINNNNEHRGKGNGKFLYIMTALEASKVGKILISDDIISLKAKYIWNTLVNIGLAQYNSKLKRFIFQNNKLEEYFGQQKKKR